MIADRLWFALALRRHGVLPWLALGLVVVAALLHVLLLPRVETALVEERAAGDAMRRTVAAPGAASAAPSVDGASLKARHDAFTALLVPSGDATRQIEALFAQAARGKLLLARAEYKWAQVPDGGFRTLEVVLPLKAPYPQVRRFADQLLIALPAAALLEAGFRRDGVGSTGLDARLRIMVYLADTSP